MKKVKQYRTKEKRKGKCTTHLQRLFDIQIMKLKNLASSQIMLARGGD